MDERAVIVVRRDSAAKFIAAAGPKVARGFRGQDPSFAPARLRQAGELGWLGILVPSSMNGLGLGLTELALVLEQAGRGLVCEPIGLAAISAAAGTRGTRCATGGSALAALHAGEPFVIPNPWDVGSARLLAALGFKALASALAQTLADLACDLLGPSAVLAKGGAYESGEFLDVQSYKNLQRWTEDRKSVV